jgi:hypothetical protein
VLGDEGIEDVAVVTVFAMLAVVGIVLTNAIIVFDALFAVSEVAI